RKPVQPLSLSPRAWDNNRDWIISIDCQPDALIIASTYERITLDSILAPGGDVGLVEKFKKMIERRQAAVPDGEPPFRPMIRFRVAPAGLRTYYVAYPILDSLHVPMSRENIERSEESKRTSERR